MNKIEALAWYLYKKRGETTIGKDVFPKYLNEIKELDFIEFLTYNIRNFADKYNYDFLLCTPSLWEEFTKDDWLLLMQKIGDRPKDFKIVDDAGIFSDIQFLCKYLEVDGISMYLSLETIRNENKLTVLNYVNIHQQFFVKSQCNYEDFEEGDYVCDLTKLLEIKKSLLKDNSLESFPNTEQDVERYIKNLFWQHYGKVA